VSEHRIGPEDAGRTVEVAAGDRVRLALPETGGTGYTWEVEALPDGGRLVEEHYEHAAGSGIGGASLHVFVFEPGAGGPLRLRQLRPWLGEAGVVERYEVELRVTEPGR
jgi:predicted secreted protein